MNNNGAGHAGSIYQNTNSSTSTLRPRNNRLISYEDGSTSTSSTPPRFDSRDTSPSARKGKTIRDDRRASVWESLSFQGIASILGNDGSPIKRSSSLQKPGPGRMLFDKSSAPKQAPQEWGPRKDPKPTSIEEQRALLQAKRREILLSQSVEQQKDKLGRYKRKDSDADLHPPLDNDVLVYRHKVLPNDTIAGVVIKYSCQPEAFRKVNRFWPNDNIQRKTYVVLPVDACAVKGRKTDGPYIADMTEPFPSTEEQDYKHDCWVTLPSFSQPIEILRMSKRTLGYFPPARRKSINSPFSDSVSSTPKTSFDMLRHPPTHAAQQAQLHPSISLNNSPVRQSRPRLVTMRTRSSSTVSNGPFLTSLQGPGGVGTLRGLRTERARPGPAEDPLNKKFASYIPDLLPPEEAANSLGANLRLPRTTTSLRTTPRESMDSIRSTRSNSSSVPAAIAGWVGKVATSPMRRKVDNVAASRNSGDLMGQAMGMGDLGDLIELDATPDEVSKQLHEEITPTATPVIGGGEEDLMNERFPIRGRVRRAYEND